jgi:PKD repeat protein
MLPTSGASPHRARRGRLGWALPAALAALLALAQPALAATPAATASSGGAVEASVSPHDAALGNRIADIALSQVGAGDNPVATSFSGLNCNPYTSLVGGFSANSNGCGSDAGFDVRNSNENWCSDFAKWVWRQAGITQDMNTINAAASSFYAWALDDGQTPQADTGTPQVGDAIVFFGAGAITATRYADHVGIVVAVNADGTIDMVNGDFLGASNVHVEHDTNLTLATFAPNTWGAGEQWVIVHPPASAQQPNPQATVSGPRTVVTGTEAHFRADASERGGAISAYYWTFGDGRATNATGAEVTHVFSKPGTYTITATATSSFGTITTVHRNVTVVAASGSVAAVPSTATWYTSYPVSYYRFVRSGDGLAADEWDGASWLQVAAGGTPAATGSIAALAYPDGAADSATSPHAFFRAADGSLAETALIDGAWTTTTLPGSPAAGADIVAAATPSGPAVFFVDARGRLAATTQSAGVWTTRTVPGGGLRAAPLALAETASGPRVFAVAHDGRVLAAAQAGRTWATATLPARVSWDAALAALTTPNGAAAVVLNGATAAGARGAGALVQLTQGARGAWKAVVLPGRPAVGSAVFAANELTPATATGALGAFPQPPGSLDASGPTHPLSTVVAFRGSTGVPAVTWSTGAAWRTTVLPGSATAVSGLSAFPVAHQPTQVYLDTAAGPAMDTTGDTAPPTGPWTTEPLPTTPATFAGRVLLYAAGSQDEPAATAAAAAAGLPASQVTTSFAVAWAATLSGQHLVITVGQAATNALEYNTCGWANPSAVDPGSTPFDYVTAARTTLPGAELFANGAAATVSQGQQRATGLAYFATHGALPTGETTLPAAAHAARTCLGSAS